MLISIFPLFFIIRQVHTQPVITTSNSTARAPAAGATIIRGTIGVLVFIAGEFVDMKHVVLEMLMFVVSIIFGSSEVVGVGHTLTCTVLGM